MKNHYGDIQKKPNLIKEKEKEVSLQIVKEIKADGKKNKRFKIRHYNHLLPHLLFHTSFVYIKTISSKIILNFLGIMKNLESQSNIK